MTDSGQEPPGKGRDSADLSAPKPVGVKRTGSRRRRRRAGGANRQKSGQCDSVKTDLQPGSESPRGEEAVVAHPGKAAGGGRHDRTRRADETGGHTQAGGGQNAAVSTHAHAQQGEGARPAGEQAQRSGENPGNVPNSAKAARAGNRARVSGKGRNRRRRNKAAEAAAEATVLPAGGVSGSGNSVSEKNRSASLATSGQSPDAGGSQGDGHSSGKTLGDGANRPRRGRKRKRGGKRSVFTRAEVGLPGAAAPEATAPDAAVPGLDEAAKAPINGPGFLAGGQAPAHQADQTLPDRTSPDSRGVHQPRAGQASHADAARANGEANGRFSATRQSNHRPERDEQQLYAALDLGTNNCRLLIAKPEERGFRVVDAYSRIVRLGEGVGANRRLGEPAMERAIDALANCHRKLAERGVLRSRLIATEACRAAENGDEFIRRVQKETGLALEVVNRETEARLAVAGCVSLVDQQADGVILFDIGGGSSEIVWLDLRNRCGARGFALTRFVRAWTSLPVGVVNLAERHGGVHVTPEIFEAMVEDVSALLEKSDLGADLTEAIASGGMHMLGTSGTVTTLAGVHLGLKRYDRRRVDGTWLEDGQVGAMIDHLREMPYEKRVENPCIGADRADLVLAGCAILEAIRRRWTCSRLRVADRGLREGILTELMAADGVWSRKGNGRRGRYRGRK